MTNLTLASRILPPTAIGSLPAVVVPRTVDEHLGVLAHGLAPHAAAPARVIVVGAGMAGLVAASELARAGHDPVLIEAQQRVGGRVLTLREPFAPGLWAEAGAMRLPQSHRLTMALIERFGLPTQPFTMDNDSTYCFFGGTRCRRAELHGDPGALGFEVTERERRPAVPALERRAQALPDAPAGRGRRGMGRDRGRVRPVRGARVPRAAGMVRRRDRDVRPPVQPGGADELVVPRAAARGGRRLLHEPRCTSTAAPTCCRARSSPTSAIASASARR